MFKREKVVAVAWSVGAVLWKSGLLLFLFFGGMVLFVAAKRAGSPDLVVFYQNIGVGVSTTALVLLLMYWWQMDGTGEMQNDLKDLKKQNKLLEDKLTANTTLLQQLVDKANQPATNALATPANLTNTPDVITKLASPDQAAVASNGHVSNGS